MAPLNCKCATCHKIDANINTVFISIEIDKFDMPLFSHIQRDFKCLMHKIAKNHQRLYGKLYFFIHFQ